MAVEDSLDIFGSDPFGRDYLYGLSTGRERLGLQPPPQGLQLDTRPYDQMQATQRGVTSGLFSDVFGRTLNMPSIPRTGIPALDLLYMNRNPVLNMMGVGDVQKTAERISYGQPLTTGSGMTLRPREEAVFAGMAVAPFVGEAVNLGTRAGRAGARMVGERMAENVTMGRPNLPSMFAEPRSSLFAVEPNPSMAAADESSAMRQQLTGKMQALLAQKKVATSAVEVGAINQQISELQAQFKSLPAVGRVAREVVAPEITAPVSDLGFYSAAEQAAMNLERSKGTGQSFLNDLMNAPDVKKDELSWIGLDDFLKDKPNVTKQEVQDFIASNKIDLQEVQLSGDPNKTRPFVQWSPSDQNYLVYGDDEVPIATFNTSIDAQKFVDQNYGKPTKYDKYQLAGGKNYREILLKLPEQNVTEKTWQVLKPDGTTTTGFFTTEEAAIRDAGYIGGTVREAPPINYVTGYRSSHWGGDTNVLAHMRVNDRIDADGKKMLLVEELQSDWHQAGRESGYKTGKERNPAQVEKELTITTQKRSRLLEEAAALPDSEMTKFKAMNEEIKKLSEQATKLNEEWTNLLNKPSGVPDAPFKDTWYQLSLKRILKYAADNGYERVGLTTGKQQVDRYKMSNEVNSLAWRDAGGGVKRAVSIDLINGDNMTLSVNSEGKLMGGDFKDKSLSSVLGKDLAKKIMSEDSGNLMGNGLNIGGEGMKAYYDEIYPKFLEKYGKKWDAGVGETKVNTVKERAENSMIPIMGQEPVRYIDITPKMKEGVKKGQPLAAAEQTPEMLASGGLDYADPFKNPLLESTIG